MIARQTVGPSRILLHAPTWVGDVVMATASFADVRRAYPDAAIHALVRPGRDRILSGSPDIDDLVVDRAGSSPVRMLRLARELRERRYDTAILFTNSFRSALIAALAGIPARIGLRRNLRGPLLTVAVEDVLTDGRRAPIPMARFYSRICEGADVAAGDGRPRLHVTPACEAKASELREALGIAPGERLVGLTPGASFGASKLWPPACFARLADEVTGKWGVRTLVLVGPGEEPIARAILAAARTRPIFDPGRLVPLDALKPIVRDLALLVTTDTGTRHYAVAFDVPVVVVMGPTDPRWTAIHLERTEVVRKDLPCSPCHLKACPIDHRCMRGIEPKEVLERIEALHARLRIFG